MIGFDKILIIDHLSKDLVLNKINILPQYYKDKVEIIRFNKEGSYKLHFLNNIIIPYMKKYCNKYFIHLDGDEYINLNNIYNNAILILIDKINSNFNKINFNYVISSINNYNLINIFNNFDNKKKNIKKGSKSVFKIFNYEAMIINHEFRINYLLTNDKNVKIEK